jgi:uncharacterized phage protein (TIGR01671 family)
MREIKFRGQRLLSNEWVYGQFTIGMVNNCYISHFNGAIWNVKPETVGQYTGLKDKNGNGKDVYEADIFSNNIKTARGVVSWNKDQWVVKFPNYQYSLSQFLENDEERETIGNIHENPELLK